MKKHRRIISALILVCMLFSLAACGSPASSGTSSGGASPGSTSSGGTSSSGGAASDSGADTPSQEPIDVSIAMWNFAEPNGNEYGERVMAKIRDEYGINMQIVSITQADYREKISTLAASDNLPDMFVALGWDDKLEFKKLVDQELVRAIPKELYSKYPNVNRVMEKYAYETMPDGQMYHIPRDDRIPSDMNGDPIGFYYRKDWAEKLGYTNLDEPMTISEFGQFLTDMAQKDPDGNGKADTYGMGNSNGQNNGMGFFINLIYPMFGYRPWMLEDGAWTYGLISEKAKEATEWLHEMYLSGGLDPEFVLSDETKLREKMSTGTLGVMPYNMNLSNAKLYRTQYFEKIAPDANIEDQIGFLPLPTMEDGKRNSAPKTYWSCTLISSKVDDAKLDRILAFYDWLCDTDGYIYATWGEEGKDYEVVDGEYRTLLTNADGAPVQFGMAGTFSLMGSLASWHLDGIPDAVDSSVTEWDKEADRVLMETYWPYNYPVDFSKYLFTPQLAEFDADAWACQELVKIIMQTTDFEAGWQKYVDTLYREYNLEAVTQEVNEAAKEQGTEWTPYK